MKKLLLVLLTLAMVIGIAACSGSSDNGNTEQRDSSTVAEQSTPSTPVQEEPTNEEPAQDEPEQNEPATPQIPNGAIDWSEAGRHIGENATVYGEVKGITYATGSKGKPTFINIGVNYPDKNRVTALIWNDYRGNFSPSPENQYSGKTICVTGNIDTYNGVVQIEVRSPSQIEIIE